MNILVPSIPRTVRITDGMLGDFLCDPVMAAKVLLGLELDIFQRARLRYYWWVPFGIDSSGITSGKTIVDWAYIQLRCLLLQEHHSGVFYFTFDQGKKSFWLYYGTVHSRFLDAHLGQLDEKGEEEGAAKLRGQSAYTAYYRNGSQCIMPAPGWMSIGGKHASLRLNTALIEEYPLMDASAQGGEIIDQQVLRAVTKESWNQDHPIWSNHIKFTAHARTMMHPAFDRVRKFEKEVRRGNPSYYHVTWNYKHYSNNLKSNGKTYRQAHRVVAIIDHIKKTRNRADFLGEALGIWSRDGKGWYTEDALLACCERGASKGLRPILSRRQDPQDNEDVRYFLGADPAPAQSQRADDGALAVLRAHPTAKTEEDWSDNPANWNLDFVYARVIRGARADQWAGFIHRLHQGFRFSKILMDLQGGGAFIWPELEKGEQMIEGVRSLVRPIARVDAEGAPVTAELLLHMFRRRAPGIEAKWPELHGDDNLIDAGHCEMKQAIDLSHVSFPKDWREWTNEQKVGMDSETQWALRCLSAGISQFGNILVATKVKPDGSTTWDLTANSAHRFSAKGRKDIQTACMMAYLAFLIWLKHNDAEWQVAKEDEGMCYAF